ncbi:MAG: DUF2971 domain-containing protein [Pseudomonadota bacterium]
MWATYGDNHKGVCLVFEKSLLRERIKQHFSGRSIPICGDVNYDRYVVTTAGTMWQPLADHKAYSFKVNDETDNLETQILEKVKAHSQSYFFHKHEDWAGENEYRFVAHSETDTPEFIDYGQTLVGIACGMDCTDGSLEIATVFANSRKIPVVQTHWSLNGWLHERSLGEVQPR